MGRTFVIGDIHGEREALDRLLGRLPWLAPDDTLVFLGDYIDRGPDSRGVIDTLRRLPEQQVAKIVCLRGNHEDAWLECWKEPQIGFLTVRTNGCGEMYRSFVDGPELGPTGLATEEIIRMLDVRAWLPAHVVTWMAQLPIWYEDEHAIYVHAGLEGEGTVWQHPRDSRPRAVMWMREPDFWLGYAGKPLVFGHTPTSDLPPEDATRSTPWTRGPLTGIDTGCGRGGPLTCLELPAGTIYTSA